jgi:threonine/homoserine/homoserine lactone efflux protein
VIQEAMPNNNAVWIALIQMIGTAFAVWLAYRQNRKTTEAKAVEVKEELHTASAAQAAKLDEVHQTAARTEVLVNGDRAAKEQRIKELEGKMRAKGLNPDD